ncbi:Multidrug resistance-associated protein 1-like protein 5 [Colletotrichum musicola]|uniref:Multidrug resistance-associated protein 1-like protein 5 n=1 Tax=Colletotrichum musicola TaxID=2175873 RepID=A0A8H6K4G9_9PEZI|nr:Multidrug resistance-associated protein 1-like protein 5 [Colletotrichum musicola]
MAFAVPSQWDSPSEGIILPPCLGDSLIRPPCGYVLDFTRRELYFSILPASVAILWGLLRSWEVWKRPVVTQGSLPRALKLIAWKAIAAIQIASLVLFVLGPRDYAQNSTMIISFAVSIASSVVLILLSRLEHKTSRAPSALIQVFLLATIILDAVRAWSEWLVTRTRGNHRVTAALLTAQVAVKVVLLVLESKKKPGFITIPATEISREEQSGIFGRSLSLWINPLLRLGYKKDLELEDLEPVNDVLSGKEGFARLVLAWGEVDQEKPHSLALAVLKAFWLELSLIHIPRLAMVAFGLAQPLLVRATIEYIQNHHGSSVGNGYTLIAAFAFVYIGIAIATLWTGQLTTQLITAIRGSLIAVVYKNMLSLRAETGNSQSAVALMSNEVERITVAAEWSVAIVPNLVQVALAMWILGAQLGAVCVAPVLIAVFSVLGGVRTGQLVPPRQRRWMQAIQKRVGITTEVISAVKGVKMSGLSGTVRDQIQGLRDFELEESKKFRKVQIANVLIGQFPSIMTPAITFAAFAIVQLVSGGEPLNVVQAFTSLSLLSILISPVSELVTIPHNLGSAIGCLDRIQEYLVKEKRVDYRTIVPSGETDGTSPLIKVSGGSFGWTADKPILHDLDLAVEPSSLTILVGAVGSGKSTLLKSLVGETYRISGAVDYRSSLDVAYCDQDPWILNQSIKDNIIGAADYEPQFYQKVIEACQLEEDLALLPKGDETLVGSSGGALSGGQKHRIALARAVYSGKQVVIMDDNLKGLDSNTASKCFNALFGAQGLLREQKRAVLFATHNAQWLRFADQIIALDADGKISERGSYEELSKAGGYVSKLRVVDQQSEHEDNPQKNGDAVKDNGKKQDKKDVKPDGVDKSKARGAANTSALLYYIKSMGKTPFAVFVAMVLSQMAFRTMQRLWIKFWVSANEAGGDRDTGMWMGVYILWAVLTELSVFVECFYFLVVIVPHSAKGLHFGVLKTALSAPMSFFVKTDTGVIINRFSQDMNLVDLPLPIAFMLALDYFTLAIAELVLTCIATGYLALAIPFLSLALYLIQRIYLQTTRQVRLLDLEAKSPIFSHFIASFTGLVTIRALSWPSRVQAENLDRLAASQRAFYAMASLQRWLLLVLNLTVAGLAVLLVSSAVALRGSIDPGLLGVALVGVIGFGKLLTMLLTYWASLETSLGAVARIREFRAETPAEPEGGDAELPSGWPSEGKIRISGVSASYDDHQVLRDVNLDIQPGEKVAICGRTGSGKSTLLALLSRLHDPSSGTIEIDGVDVSSIPIEKLREALVALPQDALFLPGTVRRNLDPFDRRDDEALWEALEKTGLKALFEDKGGLEADLDADWLSAGQKQLFCLARAILREGRVLLLDEATSSLDQATEQVVQDLIRSEFKDWTVVVIAHRLRAVADFDKIVALEDGRVVEFDKPQTLLESGGVFASLWKLQEGSATPEI